MKIIRKTHLIFYSIALLLLIGTVSYHYIEGWNYVDAFYFTGITITTIGYGDLHPTTPLSKIFTVFFALGGVGIALFSLSVFATSYFERREQVIGEAIHEKVVALKKSVTDKKELARKKRDIIAGSASSIRIGKRR